MAATTTAMPSHGHMETTTQYHEMHTTQEHRPHYTTNYEKEEYHEDKKEEHKSECPSAGGCRGSACNEAMAKWRQEMSQWKYMQNEWVKEFKYWKQENERMDWNDGWQEEWDMHKPDQHKDDQHKDNEYDNHYDNDASEDMMEMAWFDDIWQMVSPFLDDPDTLCPLLGMIGEGWEDGCRQQMETQAAFVQLFDNMEYMNSDAFSSSFCQMVGGIMMNQFNNFGMPEVAMAVEYAGGSCKCLVHNIHDMSSNGFNFGQVANIGSCANTITNYVNMLMDGMSGHGDMDHHDMGEMAEWYSEENVNKAVYAINALNLDWGNENLVNLLKWWDTQGTFKSWGIFDPAYRSDENVVKAIAYSWIYLMNTNPEFSQEDYISVLMNAEDWGNFYTSIFDMAVKMFEKQHPNKDASMMVMENWQMIMGMMENFWKFFNENFSDIDMNDFYGKLVAMSWNEDLSVDAVREVFENFVNNKQDVNAVTQLVNSYDQWFVANNDKPQKMHFLLGLAKCLNADKIAEWNTSTSEDMNEAKIQVEENWAAGLKAMYEEDGEFQMCMMPFNEFAFEYDYDHHDKAEVDMSAWYSEEAVGASIAVISGLNLEVNDDLLQILKWWDTDGKFEEMGIFNEDTRTFDNVVKAVAFSWIYVMNTSDLSQEDFVSVLTNANQWNEFYQTAYDMARNMFAVRFPDQDADEMVKENWGKIMEMMENFWTFFNNNFLEREVDLSEFYQKLSAMSWAEDATAEAVEEVFEGFMNDMFNPETMTNMMNKYDAWFMQGNTEPQKMHYMFGLASCLNLDQVQEWNNVDMSDMSLVAGLVEANWTAGIANLYVTSEDFRNCMEPFNEFAYDYNNNENDTVERR